MTAATTSPAIRRGLTVDSPPHWRGGETAGRFYRAFIYAAVPAVLSAAVFFGWHGLAVIVLAMVSSLAAEWAFAALTNRPSLRRYGGLEHTLLMGLLLGMVLPATVSWHVPVMAATVGVVVGKGLFGGLGHYVWHPALVGRLAAQIIYPEQLAPANWRVLDRVHALLGNVSHASDLPVYTSWFQASAAGSPGFKLAHPMQAIHEFAVGSGLPAPDGSAGAAMFKLIWLKLPALQDAVLGATAGEAGATCAAAVILGGLVLVLNGCLRWQMPAVFLLGAGLAAAVCPLQIGSGWQWLPGLLVHGHMPVGPIYVVFHLVSGPLLLTAFFLSADPVSRPLTARGQIIFGLLTGAAATVLRLYYMPVSGPYIALLAMNTFVPLIDRITQPRPFGR